jgi:CBS domain-containing protein
MIIQPTGGPRLAAPPEVLDDDPQLSAVMSRDVVVIDAEARLPTALYVMATTGVRHPAGGRPRAVPGVLVETDLIRCLAEGIHPIQGRGHRDAATAVPPCAELAPTARVSEAARPRPPTSWMRCSSAITAASWASSPPPTWCACSPYAPRSMHRERRARPGRARRDSQDWPRVPDVLAGRIEHDDEAVDTETALSAVTLGRSVLRAYPDAYADDLDDARLRRPRPPSRAGVLTAHPSGADDGGGGPGRAGENDRDVRGRPGGRPR